MHLIPVAINYDRLFEIRNLATEIVSGDQRKINMLDLRNMINSSSAQTVGKVYVTFGKEINLKEYFKERDLAPLNQANFDKAALGLTSHLVL